MTVSQKPRILIVLPNYHPFIGGIETLFRIFLRNEFVRDSIHPLVVYPDRLAQYESGEGYKVEGIDVMPMSGFGKDVKWAESRTAGDLAKIWASVRQFMQDFQPNLVHVNALAELTVPFLAIADSMNIPRISHLHGEIPVKTNKTYLDFISLSSRILVVSEAVRKSLRNHGVPADRIGVLTNGVNSHQACVLDSKKVLSNQLIMVGRLDYQKGFLEGLRAFKILLTARPSLRMIIVGAGPEISNLVDYTVNEGIQDRVKFEGPLSLEATRDRICESAVLLVPSIDIEGFGLVAAEAGRCKVPVVATKVGGLPETVISGKSGLLVEPNDSRAMADATEQILSSTTFASSLGNFAKKHIEENFSEITFAERLLTEYRRAII